MARMHMHTSSKRIMTTSRTKFTSPIFLTQSAFVVGAVLIFCVLLLSASSTVHAKWTTATAVTSTSQSLTTAKAVVKTVKAGTIESGTVLKIPYYHCSSVSSSSTTTTADVVLLHGAAFTKEDWKTSGILELFCAPNSKLAVSVTALDLSVQSKADILVQVLLAATAEKLSTSGQPLIAGGFPIAALVTPSASGSIILDGIASGHADLWKEFIRRWIPVATGAVLQYQKGNNQELLVAVKDWPILAIYGDLDVPGKQSSEFLHKIAPDSVTVVEMAGRHPVYLDSPNLFVETILQQVAQDKNNSG